jgi:uncharacterized protein (TIGR03435 family)
MEPSGKTLRLPPPERGPNDANPRDFTSIGLAGRWVLANTSMPQLAKFASDYVLRAPVLDRTELSGSFDYKQTLDPESEIKYADHDESFLQLIKEVGLKLERSKGRSRCS